MLRNVVWLVSSIAALGVLFYGYLAVTRIAPVGRNKLDPPLANVDRAQGVTDERIIKVSTGEGVGRVEPGKKIEFTFYEEGLYADGFGRRPTQHFQCDRWTKVPGTRNDVEVDQPQLTLYPPRGEIVTIAAENGRITVEEIEGKRPKPQRGWLAGDVRVTIDRLRERNRPPAAERPDDIITVRMDRLDFDLELGTLRSTGALRVTSREFNLDGQGLQLVWNQADNRPETVVIERCDRLALLVAPGIFEGVRSGDGTVPEAEAEADKLAGTPDAATENALPAATADDTPRSVTTFACSLTGAVRAVHYRGEYPIGDLTAEELYLLFDTDNRSRRAFAGTDPSEQKIAQPTAADQHADAEDADPPPERTPDDAPQRLVIDLDGPLKLTSIATENRPGPLRREFEARGETITLSRYGHAPVPLLGKDTTIRCGQLTFHEHSKRVWLSPDADGRVTLTLRGQAEASANNIYIDQTADLVKLVGNVVVASAADPRNPDDQLAIRCNQWAELRLASSPETAEAEADLAGVGMPESALFVGAVRAELPTGTLRAQRLEAFFSNARVPAPGPTSEADPASFVGPPFETQQADGLELVAAFASGNVRLESGGQTLHSTTLSVGFHENERGQPYPAHIDAQGPVVLRDPEQGFAAEGRRLRADLTIENQLDSAQLFGTPERPARLVAREYDVRGRRIDIDLFERPRGAASARPGFLMTVPDQAELRFVTMRSLQGKRRTRPTEVLVRCEESMQVDARRADTTVRFAGRVVARSRDEWIEADELTLSLVERATQDASRSASGIRSAGARFRQYVDRIRSSIPGTSPDSDRGLFAASNDQTRFRQELSHVRARNASVYSESYDAGQSRPYVSQNITAPELDVDVNQRIIRTVGETYLGMTSLRPPGEAAEARARLGLPSALVSRGPSQTVLKCDRAMTYQFGQEGPQRRDIVLFEGGVRFLHLAGREVRGLDELMPELARDPEALKQLKSRNTFLRCERLELTLAARDAPGAPDGRSLRSPQRLDWLNATGDVHLQDKQGAGVRDAYAAQIEFDRSEAKLRVIGDREQNRLARILYENAETGRFDKPAIGPAFTVFLDSNTVKAEKVTGTVGR